MSKKQIAIIGAAGFTGQELIRLLSGHPEMECVLVTSNQSVGKTVEEVFPALQGKSNLTFEAHSASLPEGIPVFLAVPNESSLELVPKLLSQGHTIVDLSGSYRLHNLSVFEKYYNLNHASFDLMEQAVYGLPELFRQKIQRTKLVANPGCFTTSAIVPLYIPGELRKHMDFISIDAKSGVSGAGGRVEGPGFSFTGVHENFRAYKILKHQHQPEIEEYAAYGVEQDFPDLVFTPHLLPVFRGILTTTVIRWKSNAPADLDAIYRDFMEKETFLRFTGAPESVEISRVQNTNFLDIGLRSEGRNTVIVSALDNLIKGAAGQAIQNMNLLLGIEESAGLL